MTRTSATLFFIISILLTNPGSHSVAEAPKNSTASVLLPSEHFSFQPGEGQEVANTYCLICHSADYIYTQPEHSQKKWESIVTKMQKVFGCPIAQGQVQALSLYLYNQNSVSLHLLPNFQ